jgi:predicted HicB family RNase H-like nuclease
VVVMAFKIEKEEYVNRTFRLSKKLIDRMNAVCDEKNISLNKLIVMCVNYALDELETENPPID